MERLDELVIKPRDGFGGHGVTIMPRGERAGAPAGDRRWCGADPRRFIAQETVAISSHPTVCGERLRAAPGRSAALRRQRPGRHRRRCRAG